MPWMAATVGTERRAMRLKVVVAAVDDTAETFVGHRTAGETVKVRARR